MSTDGHDEGYATDSLLDAGVARLASFLHELRQREAALGVTTDPSEVRLASCATAFAAAPGFDVGRRRLGSGSLASAGASSKNE